MRPSLKVKFIPAEISESNARQRGKTLCLKLIGCLDKHLIICVDSDFDKFLNPDLLQASKHILQTHTYSCENHQCQATNLQSKWNELQCGSFDFYQFILDFSRLLYPAVLCILTAKMNGLKAWTLDSLCRSILQLQVNQNAMLADNGKLLLEKISLKIDEWTDCQPPLADEDLETTEQIVSRIGMNANNTYLYMQGHCVYDLVLRIGNFLCNGKHDFKCEVLDQAYMCSGYNEIDLVKADVRQVL